jgi:phage protein D
MAAKSKRAAKSAKKAGEAASSLRSNPYVQRLIEDDELRDNLRDAVESARDAYARIATGKGPAAIMEDKKVQKDLRQAAESLREASEQLRGKRKKSRLGKIFLIALLGGIVAVLLSEDIRKALLDKLFGAEEEFEYSSTTSPSSSATPASTASGSSS